VVDIIHDDSFEESLRRLITEFQIGWESGEKDGWISMDDAETQLGIPDE